MLHELLVTLSGYPGDIFRPFPQEPEPATTFAITDFPLLHPSEKEGLDRLAQLGFYFREFNNFIASCRRLPSRNYGTSVVTETPTTLQPGLYLKAFANALERKLQCYRQVIVDTEAAILSGEDNLGGVVPLPTITARFAPFQLVFPAISNLIAEIRSASTSETPFTGGRLINFLQDKAASGVPIQKEWMDELLRGCCAVMMRQIVSWVIYGQIQDPFGEFFIVQCQPVSDAKYTGIQRGQASESLLRSRSATAFRTTRISSTNTSSSMSSIKWETEYALDETTIPAMIPTTLAEAMLFIGKSIATARQAKPKPIPIPQSMTSHHLELIMPLVDRTSRSIALDSHSMSGEILNLNLLSSVMHQIRRDIADHLWVVVQVGERVVRTLESFRKYFLLCDGEYGLGLIDALEEFKRNRLSRLGQFSSADSTSISIRDHDLGGMLSKAAQNTSAQDDPALQSFELRLLKRSKAQEGAKGSSDSATTGMFDDQHLGIPIRLWYTLTWPLDFFLTNDDIEHYADVFAFLLTVRKAQVKLQQAWIEVKTMTQQLNSRRRGRGARAYSQRIKGAENDHADYEQETEMLKYIAVIRSDMIFVVDCLWTYLQTDVIGPTYDSLLQNIITQDTDQRHTGDINSSSPLISAHTFDTIHSSHAEALYEIRRACFLTSTTLSSTIKSILAGAEIFCGILGRRAAGQNGFQVGIDEDQDESIWQDWADISRLNQAFRDDTKKLFSNLSIVSRSGTLGDGPSLKRSVSGLGSSIIGNGSKSFDVIRQVDQLLLRLEYSKSMWFASKGE
ncbi:Gamma-tubulin complex component 4 [Mortierella sp. GBA30]|nr:Gamma-tubulin complex component 4 [Mortierella sp. GBA30]